MPFASPVSNLITSRVSSRTYIRGELVPALIEQLEHFTPAPPPFGSEFMFKIVHLPDVAGRYLGSLGTYGMVRGAEYYMLGAVKQSLNALVDFGYSFEMLILKAQDLGLGTCWLGGTFARSRFFSLLEPRPNYIMPCISPLGNISGTVSGKDKLYHLLVGSHKRRPFNKLFFDGDLDHPLSVEAAGLYGTPLSMLRLAPSAANRQPWRVVKEGDELFHFYRKRSSMFSAGMKLAKMPDLQLVDMGIAMCHFELAARAAGLSGEWVTMKGRKLSGRYEYVVSWRGE